jgi:uncharacterized metal-binding protein
VGQLSNQAAIELTQEGFGKLSCLAGVGAHLSGFVQSARDIDNLVVIDGCPVGCAKGVLEQAEVPVRGYLVITDLGIDKNKDLNPKRDEVKQVKEAVRRLQANSGEQAQTGGQEGNLRLSPVLRERKNFFKSRFGLAHKSAAGRGVYVEGKHRHHPPSGRHVSAPCHPAG